MNLAFDHSFFLGYVHQVLPSFLRIHIPSSWLTQRYFHKGQDYQPGLVGTFVVIEGDKEGFIGKIVEVSVPERERLGVKEQMLKKTFEKEKKGSIHPIAKVEIQLSFDYFDENKLSKALYCYPHIGAKVFVCQPDFLISMFKSLSQKDETEKGVELGTLVHGNRTSISFSLQSIFSRHCAIVGTTGGGKSWTIAALIEKLKEKNAKVILLDATGEYEGLNLERQESIEIAENSFFPYQTLTTDSLIALFRATGQAQQPLLMNAIRSLKIVHLLNSDPKLDRTGLGFDGQSITKEGQPKEPYSRICQHYSAIIDGQSCNFDINFLSKQVEKECVYDSDFKVSTKFGGINPSIQNYASTLIMRINRLLFDPNFINALGFEENSNETKFDLCKKIDNFLDDNEDRLLKISLSKVASDFQLKEILVDSIGKYILNLARKGKFKEKGVVLFLDEAHIFLNKYIKDEYFEASHLKSFELIAKEGRKYGLYLCLATQMPRDIPTGVLSQMGTFIVHRLINQYDIEAIATACSTANRSSLDFLPVLGQGEAIIMSVEYPMPIVLKMNEPEKKPKSNSPLL